MNSERVFSTTGDIVSARRSTLPHDHVDQLIFLKKDVEKHTCTSSLDDGKDRPIKIYNGKSTCERTSHAGMETLSEEKRENVFIFSLHVAK